MKKLLLFFSIITVAFSANAQDTKRELPKEWGFLTLGGRFKDRFLPMPNGKAENGTWGSPGVRPRLVCNGIELPEISFWGGNILQGKNGLFHLFVCGWPENSPKGHMEWPNSTVYNATSTSLSGPYTIRDTIGKGHNPEVFKLKDGRYVLYVIGGYYIADNIDGPWTYSHFEFDTRDRRIIEGLSNLTFAQREDGSVLMICRGGGVWISRTGISPYMLLTDKSVYPNVEGAFEDPVVWRDDIQYNLIVNDWLGRVAYYLRSKDGIHWITEPGEAYTPGISVHQNGHVEEWYKYERAKVFQDKIGRAIQMNFAVIDTSKWEDKPNDRHSSKNICIPLNRGMRLEVLNKKAISALTKTIEVKILAEEGFNPQKEIDIESLRFGSCNEVNYGRGCRPIKTRCSGTDLIVTFDGKGSGITASEFAPKMVGKDTSGKLVFGYVRMPFVNHTPPLLSSKRPIYDSKLEIYTLEVQNFGLTSSPKTSVRIMSNGLMEAEGSVKALAPYEKVQIRLPAKEKGNDTNNSYQVLFINSNDDTEVNTFNGKP